ncbi:MAG: hypothetical protein ACKPKO_21210, partial [Candidatus Fonsibacter sp.]
KVFFGERLPYNLLEASVLDNDQSTPLNYHAMQGRSASASKRLRGQAHATRDICELALDSAKHQTL